MRMHDAKVALFFWLLLTACDDCESLGGAAEVCGDFNVTLPLADHYPVVDATINGEPARVLLDTGVGYNAASPTMGYVSATLLGSQQTHVYVDSVCLGGMCLRDVTMYAVDTPFSEAGEGAINATLGMGLFRRFDLEFDHMETVSLSYPAGGDPFDVCASPAVPLTDDEFGRPFVDSVTADDQALGALLLDTGAKYTLRDQSTVDALAPYLQENAEEEGGCSFDGCEDDGYFVSTLNQYCVAETCVENLPVKYPVWNVVGCTYLENFRAVVSFKTNELALCSD